jgi:hypothetical protein
MVVGGHAVILLYIVEKTALIVLIRIVAQTMKIARIMNL